MDIDAALEAARSARGRAYAPYSGFRMGAAVVTDRGSIITGALVENVSLGLAMCAERVALFASVAAGERPTVLALASPRTDGAVTFPCGACLQVGLELGGPDLLVVAAVDGGNEEDSGLAEQQRLADLLPRGPHKS